jgi:hypothetical protein
MENVGYEGLKAKRAGSIWGSEDSDFSQDEGQDFAV